MIFILSLQDTGVGKSSIVWRFVEDSFDPNINPTIGYVLLPSTSTEVLFFPSPSFVVVLQVVMSYQLTTGKEMGMKITS